MSEWLWRVGVLLAILLARHVAVAAVAAPRIPEITEPITFAKLRTHIDRYRLRSLEAVLRVLPESYRGGYNLVYDTRSGQDASRRNPRVIFHGEEATFLMAFNGEATQKGFRTLETVEFQASEHAFVLQSIDFSGAQPVYSDPNPEGCVGCHQASPRPNWENYPTWPGVYQRGTHLGSGDRARLNVPADEEADLLAFFRRAEDHPRYRHLARRDRKYRYKPTNVYADYGSDYEPPTFLSLKLTALNGRRIAKLIHRSPDYARFRYAILGALADCGKPDQFLPTALRDEWGWALPQVIADTWRRMTPSGNEFELQRPDSSYRDTVVALRYLFEGRDIDISDWSMNFREHAYGFVGPRGGGIYRGLAVFPALFELDRELGALARRLDVPYRGSCDRLAAMSRERLTSD